MFPFYAPYMAKSNAVAPFYPSTDWDGTAATGFGAPFGAVPTDPTRTTAKPVCRLMVPPNQYFTDELVIGVFAAANNAGSLAVNLGLTKVVCHFEGMTRDITAPTVYTFNDANGVSRSYLGWWVTLKKPVATAGHANVYFEAIPADGTMQRRVIGPYQFSPQDAQYDATIEVAATPAETVGVRYKTIAAALSWCRTNTKNNPLITMTEAGDYDLGLAGAVYSGQGYATITATAAVRFRKTGYTSDTATLYRTQWDGLHLMGSNITLDMRYATQLYMETSTNRKHWLDGITITDTGGRYYLLRGQAHGSTTMIRFGGILTECAVSNIRCPGQSCDLVRGCSFADTFTDVAVDCLAFIGNTVEDHSSEEYRTDLAALSITGPAGATIELSGGNGTNSRVFNAKVSGVSAGTFTVGNAYTDYTTNTNYTITNVVAWVNGLGGGWSASLLDNTRAAHWCGLLGGAGAAFSATSCVSPLTIYAMIDDHADIWGNLSNIENLICYGNRCWNINSQGIYLAVTNTKDAVIANNSLHGLNGNYTSYYYGTQSHVVCAHNTFTGQNVVMHKNGSPAYNPDARCAFLTNTMQQLAWNGGVSDADVVITNNHVETGTNPTNGTGTTIGGTTASLFVSAATGNFTPAGALLTNLKTPALAKDQAGAVRGATDAAGAVKV